MTKLKHLILIILMIASAFYPHTVYGQAHTCEDAVNIFYNGDYTIEFTRKKGNELDASYPSLKGQSTTNQIWCSYIPSEDGEVSFTASVDKGFLKMVIFKEEKDDICGEIGSGLAEIQRIQTKELKTIGLSREVGDGILYALPVKKGRKIQVVFMAPDDMDGKMNLSWTLTPSYSGPADTKVIDFRKDEFTPSVHIKLVDKATGRALIGRLSVNGNKTIAAQYIGSEFFFSIDRRCELTLNSEVEGYFFNDLIVDLDGTDDREIVIELDRVESGKSIQLEEIQFERGTSVITPESEPKLRRLKDFLVLNSELNVEIQGHVHAKGDNNRENDKLSEARAKRVMKYLIDNGIDKDRLTPVGYGNTRPIYPDAKLSHEEQANRRVEILVK